MILSQPFGYLVGPMLRHLPTRSTIQVRRYFLAVSIANDGIRTEATHHTVKPHPGHRRHGNQQSGEHQAQAQLLGNGFHNACRTAFPDDFRYKIAGHGAAEYIADQVHTDFGHNPQHDAGEDGGQAEV